ncbi:MAG: hypothetical protein WC378_00865 [Opitutaceae bacterium]|jgi:hypothetical protein
MSSEDTAELYRLIRDLTSEVSKLSIAVVRLEEQLKGRKECAEPSLCIVLRSRLDEVEKQREREKGQRDGLGLAGKAVWAFIGGGGLGVLFLAWQLLQTAGK